MTSHQQHLLSVLSDIISSLVKAVNGAFTVLLDNVAIEIQQERQRFANSLAEAKRLNDNQQSTVILEVSSDTFHVGTQTLGHTESMLSAIALFPNPDGDARQRCRVLSANSALLTDRLCLNAVTPHFRFPP